MSNIGPGSSHFIVTSYWRGSLNIGEMRHFDNWDAARDYAVSLRPEPYERANFVRAYEVFGDKKPRLIKNIT